MICPQCQHDNPGDASRCRNCKADLKDARDRIVVGQQFIFLDAATGHPVAAQIDGDVRRCESPAIFSRHLHAVAFGQEWTAPRLTPPTLDLFTVVTDRKIYRPQDEVTVFVVGLNAPGAQTELEIALAGQRVYGATVALDDSGLGLHRYADLREGEYTVTVRLLSAAKGQREATAVSEFSVAEFTLSPLVAVLESHSFEGERLKFRLRVMQLSVPYAGPVELGLQCQVCGDRVVQTQTAQVSDGAVEAEFDLSGHGGPFKVQVVTPDGEAALIAFPSTRADERQHITFNPLGRTVEGGLLPFAGANEVRGLYLGGGGVNNTPFQLEAGIAETGRLRLASAMRLAQVVVLNPITGESRLVREAQGLQPGDVLEFPVEAPYVLFTVGGFGRKGPYEGWGVVVRPVELRATLGAPKEARPGDEVAVRVEASAPAACLLLVYDARLEHESPVPKLAKRIFEQVRDATQLLHEGEPPKWSEPVALPAMAGFPLPAGPLRRRMDAGAPDMGLFARAAPMAAQAFTTGAVMEVETLALPVAPTRQEFPELVYLDLFPIEGAAPIAERTVRLGDQIGTWRCRAYVFRGLDYQELTADVQADKPVYAELDLPALIGEGDEIDVSVTYHTPRPARLTITTPDGEIVGAVAGHGRETFRLRSAGEVMVHLAGEAGDDWTVRRVEPPGVQTVTASRLMILDRGETAVGERVTVYPTLGPLLAETIEALYRYPFG